MGMGKRIGCSGDLEPPGEEVLECSWRRSCWSAWCSCYERVSETRTSKFAPAPASRLCDSSVTVFFVRF